MRFVTSENFMTPEYLTVEETARRLKVDAETVRRWLREGTLRGQKFGRVWRIPESELSLTPRETPRAAEAAALPQSA